MQKTMKKIFSVGVATTMLAASLTGALAADLKNLPAPFVANGAADVQIVIGAAAQTADMLGAIDIANSLQAASVTTTVVAGSGSAKTSVEGGAAIAGSGSDLLLGEALYDAKDKLTSRDLPELLAKGKFRVESGKNKDYDYDQEIRFPSTGGSSVLFDKSPSGFTEPKVYLDFDTSSKVAWEYVATIRGSDATFAGLNDSESITLAGKPFTVDPSVTSTGDITLFGSDSSQLLQLNKPVTVTVNGKTYEVSVVGGNSNSDSAVINVNGQQKTVKKSDSTSINGLEVFVKDLFIQDTPTLDVQASVFIGSQKIVMSAAAGHDCTTDYSEYSQIEINGNTVEGVLSCVEGTDNGHVTAIHVAFEPKQLQGDVTGFDEAKYILAGDSVKDPLLGTFEMKFAGPTSALDDASKAKVHIATSGNELEVSIKGNDGNTVKFNPYKLNSSSLPQYMGVVEDGFLGAVTAGTAIDRNDQFLLNEGSGKTKTSFLYEVSSFRNDSGTLLAKLRNVQSGKTTEYKVGDQIGSAVEDVNNDQVKIAAISLSGETVTLTNDTSDLFYLDGGYHTLQFASATSLVLQENSADGVDQATADSLTVTLSKDGTKNEFNIAASGVTSSTDDAGKKEYGLTEYGTYYVRDADEDRTLDIYTPVDKNAEVHYEVFIAPTGAAVTVTGANGAVTTQTVNQISVGAAILDTELSNVQSSTKNLIVVGGPCVNTAAKALLNLGATDACTTGFEVGKARIELFNLASGKVAMLVAGFEAQQTQAASRAVATKDSRLMGTSAELTVTSVSDYTVKSN